MASITIRRPEQQLYQSAAYTVLLDGAWAGKLLNEDRVTLQTTPGNHTVQLKFGRIRGNILSFSIGENDSMIFECESQLGFFDAFVRPARPLFLHKTR